MAMASLYPNTTTEVYEHFSNDSMNDPMNYSVPEKYNTTRSFSLRDSDMFHFIIYTAVRGPLCLVGFIANVICYVVLKADNGKVNHAATFLLQALAVADNLVLAVFFFSSIRYGLPTMLGEGGKNIAALINVYTYVYVIPFLYMARLPSVWIIVLIAINRYIEVCWPFDAHRLASLKKTKIEVAVVVTLAIILSLPVFFRFTIVYPEGSMTVPSLNQTSIGPDTLFGLVYDIVVEIIAFAAFPLILLIFVNTRIILELRTMHKRNNTVRRNGSRAENNITVVMLVIVIVFIVCNILYQIQLVAFYSAQYSDGWYVLYCVSNVLLAANSSTNFVVYYVLRSSFRRAFCKAFCYCQPQILVE